MGGLLFFFLIGLYIWVASKFVRRARPWWGKVVLVLVFILIPTADAFYGRIRLKQMCEAEGGLKINRVVKGVTDSMPHIFSCTGCLIGVINTLSTVQMNLYEPPGIPQENASSNTSQDLTVCMPSKSLWTVSLALSLRNYSLKTDILKRC